MRRSRDLKKIVTHYRKVDQVIVMIEEMSELTKELVKAMRGKANRAQIADEIADVQIMLDQMKLIFDIPQETMETFIDFKIDRQLERMKNEDQ